MLNLRPIRLLPLLAVATLSIAGCCTGTRAGGGTAADSHASEGRSGGTRRVVTISAKPPDAVIEIDGVSRGTGPIIETFDFADETEIHRILVSRPGYVDMFVPINRDLRRKELIIALQPKATQPGQ